MKRLALSFAALLFLALAFVAAHAALIEAGREVVVLRTEEPDGTRLESRLWIADDGLVEWLHGADSRWLHNLEARPLLAIVRGGETQRYRATPVAGPHPRVHELLRAKYGSANRWLRLTGPNNERTQPVRLERLDEPQGACSK